MKMGCVWGGGGVQTINRDMGSIKPSTVREEGGRTKITVIFLK